MQLAFAEIAFIFQGLSSGLLLIDGVQSPYGHFFVAARPRTEDHVLASVLILGDSVA